MSLIEITGVVFGILCVVFTIRQNIWCWPTGLIQVILFAWIFYDVKLYSDFILHLVYAVLQIYGWYYWLRPAADHSTLRVTHLSSAHRILWLAVTLIGTALWGSLIHHFTDASAPYPDAFVTSASLVAQWLMTRKKLESWWYWIVVDVAAIPLFIYKDLYLTAGLYAVFLALAVTGLIAWRRSESSLPDPAKAAL